MNDLALVWRGFGDASIEKIVSFAWSSKASHLAVQCEQRRALAVVTNNTANYARVTERVGDHVTPSSSKVVGGWHRPLTNQEPNEIS